MIRIRVRSKAKTLTAGAGARPREAGRYGAGMVSKLECLRERMMALTNERVRVGQSGAPPRLNGVGPPLELGIDSQYWSIALAALLEQPVRAAASVAATPAPTARHTSAVDRALARISLGSRRGC
jgi:hypothetical protein